MSTSSSINVNEPKKVDYSLYLVTDSNLIPKGADFFDQVEKAISKGSVTIVQLREKDIDTSVFIDRARKLHKITKKYNVPLIINDRVDVAVAVDAEGVHVGQDDMNASAVRKAIGPGKIIGVSVNNVKELEKAIADGADYVGVGTCFPTNTKKITKDIIGPIGIKEILEANNNRIPAVAIGGIKAKNVQQVLYFSSTPDKNIKPDGVAVVTAIMSSDDPAEAARTLRGLINEPIAWSLTFKNPWDQQFAKTNLVDSISDLLAILYQTRPLTHQITNLVTKYFCANISIASGSSPIMSECSEEFQDLADIPNSSCLINMGKPTPEGLETYFIAGECYNKNGRAMVFDPVGAGATQLRRDGAKHILQRIAFDVIKGNDGEIFGISGIKSDTKAHGVDSVGDAGMDLRFSAAYAVAKKTRACVLMTGKEDLLVDELGNALIFSNGSEYLAHITGSGCVLGSIITGLCAADKSLLSAEEKLPYGAFVATAAALAIYTIASERAAAHSTCTGPGTFVPLLIDEIYNIQRENSIGNFKWLNSLMVRPYEA